MKRSFQEIWPVPVIALLMCAGPVMAQQAAQPGLPPAAETGAPPIQTASPGCSQPPVAAGPDLPFAPEPQRPSAGVLSALEAVKPRGLAGKASTPVAGAEPLRLSLDDAVRLGLEFSLRIVSDVQTARQTSGQELDALNALTPSLTAKASTSTQEINLAAMGFNPSVTRSLLPPGTPTPSTIVKVDTTQAQVSLDQTLFNAPAYEIYRAARVQEKIVNLNALSDRAEVVQRVATSYLRVLADEASIRDAESQLVSDRELERQAQAKKDAGVGTNLDLLRARTSRQQREQTLVADRNSRAKDMIQLDREMGLAADQTLVLTDPVPYHELKPLPLETAKQVAFKRRKDLLSLEAQLRSASLQRKSISFERLPGVKVSGYYGVLGETRGLYHGVFVAQGGLDFPIFEETRFRGDREGADAQLNRLRGELASLREDIEQQIRSSMLDLQTYGDLVKAATSNVTLASEALSDSLQRYRAGVDDTLPVVRAQATLTNAQAQLVTALFQFNQAKLQLARNTGVLEAQYDSYLNE